MDENYINIVRRSLYKSPEGQRKKIGNMPRKEKKIKFPLDNYKSETVFTPTEKRDKIKNRKSTPFKKEVKKRKLLATPNGDPSFEEDIASNSAKIRDRKDTPFKHKTEKKRKIVISFSSDSFEEDIGDDPLNPSKSEMELFEDKFNISNNSSLYDSTDSEESASGFDMDNFFNDYEPSLNESITEAHAGINYEFESEYITNVNIIGGAEDEDTKESNCNFDSSEDNIDIKEHILPELNQLCIENNENVIVVSDGDKNSNSDATERNMLEVANKIQETVVLDGQDEALDPVLIVPDSSENLPGNENNVRDLNVADYYDFEDSTLVILRENRSISIYGCLCIKVLYGKLDVFGSVLDKYSEEINLYSPRGSALLQLTNITSIEDSDGTIDIIMDELNIEQRFDATACVIKCNKLKDISIPFIEKYVSQQIFPKIDDHNLPQVIFEPIGNWNIIKQNYTWSEILHQVKPSTKLLIVGGKGVGKSTLLRFAINRLLNVFNCIRVIDLDPGQSEFAVPGCVSIVTVKKALYGPNYTHLQATDRSLLATINVGYDPSAYIRCVESLMSYYETLDQCPTLINYMGFSQGIGLNIISSALMFVKPTDIIQIQSRHRSKNFPVDLTLSVIYENCTLLKDDPITLEYNLHKVEGMSDDNDGWSLEPRWAREMCVLAYLSRMMREGVNSVTSHKLPMYRIQLPLIKITNAIGENISPAAVNANLVALCILEEDSNIFICFGYGIVRGIDLESDTLVLLTPESTSTLEAVTHLVLGSVMLPPSVYMTPDNIKGPIPYVMEGELVSLGQMTKRSYLPFTKR